MTTIIIASLAGLLGISLTLNVFLSFAAKVNYDDIKKRAMEEKENANTSN